MFPIIIGFLSETSLIPQDIKTRKLGTNGGRASYIPNALHYGGNGADIATHFERWGAGVLIALRIAQLPEIGSLTGNIAQRKSEVVDNARLYCIYGASCQCVSLFLKSYGSKGIGNITYVWI